MTKWFVESDDVEFFDVVCYMGDDLEYAEGEFTNMSDAQAECDRLNAIGYVPPFHDAERQSIIDAADGGFYD